MDLLAQLKAEDDNPRGQHGGNFISGSNLEEAAEAERRRLEIKAQRWPIGRQEAGILHLIQSKSLFQRLKLPDPRWLDGEPFWDVPESRVRAAYEEAKKCCHPEWSYHPQRERGYKLLVEAFETLTNVNGRREAAVREAAERIREREEVAAAGDGSAGAAGGSSGSSLGKRAAEAAAAAATAADLEEQMAAKRRRMLMEAKLRREKQQGKTGTAAPLAGPQRGPQREPPRAGGGYDDEDDDDEDEEGASAAARLARARLQRPKPGHGKRPKRPGMF